MYSICLFCHNSLGRNELIENFSVGRRLAFDAAKGRLWVICPRCSQWNLTPLEERWEAVEECERRFRATVVRKSTGNIGLARINPELDLIRVGKPLLPEFAAWRYGQRLRSRRNHAIASNAIIGGSTFAAVTLSGLFAPLLVPALAGLARSLVARRTELARAQKFMREAFEKGQRETGWPHGVTVGNQVRFADLRLIATGDAQAWGLRLESFDASLDYTGSEALTAAHILLPSANVRGATGRSLELAVREIEDSRDPRWYYADALKRIRRAGLIYTPIAQYPAEIRLALELAAHEEAERKVIDGELADLERAWKDAEEIAAIADNLLIPQAVHDWVSRARGR